MFRNEKPQLGRSRQFYQLGVEYFDSKYSCFDDLEMILILEEIMNHFQIRDQLDLSLNYIGNFQDRERYSNYLRNWIQDYKLELSAEGQKMVETNILRLLDSKREGDKEIILKAGISEFSFVRLINRHFTFLPE
jgi:histidyl-tRNA synthetase